jgi:hypothetical protein
MEQKAKVMSLSKAILIGWLLVNIPITAIVLLFGYGAYSMGYNYRYGAVAGMAVGWLYWSFSVPKWRKWALSKNVDADALEKYGSLFLLTFKKNNPLSKTEIKDTKDKSEIGK